MSKRKPLTLADINRTFLRLAEVISRELTPEKLLRAALDGYSQRMAEINNRTESSAK